MTTIKEKFEELKKKKQGALIGFVMAGDPSIVETVGIVNSLVRGGVDIIELGLPFSDPIADGIVIQKASERARKAGMNPDLYFKIVKEIKGVPKVCLTYYNLVLQPGLEKFVRDCQKSGISGLIVPDLPIEEAGPLLNFCRQYDTDLIFLVAPTTTEERLKKILSVSQGFLYVVSLLGATGAREKLSECLKPLLSKIKKFSQGIPLAVGFGISKPEQVEKIIKLGADGAIVGSSIINLIEENLDDKEKMLSELENFVRELKRATVA
ncbi:tryptophan synthase subunit alpha [Patescibacteria group bacterium]|nr:tryptophan synthase subunit alpha [Patescibacteria group bacterium]MBU4481574.1 tryptophan synthase subunit alpha [Patescibacteria group bacterium]